MADRTNEPNVRLPLASSYNTRAVDGEAYALADVDQRKLNSMYAVAQNAGTGATSLKLVKRPGVSLGVNGIGSASQTVFGLITPPGNISVDTAPWVFSKLGNDIRASDFVGPTTTVIMTDINFTPAFFDRTAISTVDTVVVQCRSVNDVAQRVFYSTAIAVWTEITDAVFTGRKHRGKMEFMDGYAFIMDSVNRVYNSDLNTLATWPSTSYITKQITQDAPVGCAKLGNQILAFGAETCEAFYNGANPTGSPLTRLPQLAERVGMVQAVPGVGVGPLNDLAYYCTVSGAAGQKAIYFVGRRAGGLYSKSVIMFNGQSFERVSTDAIDNYLAGADVTGVFSVGFNGKAAVAVLLTDPGSATSRWLMYFPDYKEWFEWNSTVFSPINCGEYFAPGGSNSSSNIMYYFSNSNNFQDEGVDYDWEHQFKLPTTGNGRKQHKWAGLVGDTPRSACSIDVSVSDDDYQNFTSVGSIDMTSQKKTAYRLGGFYQRAIRLSYTGAQPVSLTEFLSRID